MVFILRIQQNSFQPEGGVKAPLLRKHVKVIKTA